MAASGFEPAAPRPPPPWSSTAPFHKGTGPAKASGRWTLGPHAKEAASVTTEAVWLSEMEGKIKGSSWPDVPSYPTIGLEFPADQQRSAARGGVVGSGGASSHELWARVCQLTPQRTLLTHSPRVFTCHHCPRGCLPSPSASSRMEPRSDRLGPQHPVQSVCIKRRCVNPHFQRPGRAWGVMVTQQPVAEAMAGAGNCRRELVS